MTNNEGSTLRTVLVAVVSLAVLSLVRRLFVGSETDQAAAERAAAFLDPSLSPEVWAADPVGDAVKAGKVYPYQLTNTAKRSVTIADAALKLYNAAGTLNDDEGAAVAAFAMPQTYPDLLVFAFVFRKNYGTSVGEFFSTNFGTAEQAAARARLVQLRSLPYTK